MRPAYPPAPKGDVVDDYHGTPVPDPYRWLEDPDAPQTVAWVEAQNALTASFLGQGDARERLRERLTRLWDYPRYGLPQREGQRYYYWKNSGLQNQPVLYAQPQLDAPEAAVLDPNTLSPDGTAAVMNLRFSRDGRLAAYGVSRSGSDWQDLHVRDMESGVDFPDVIRWCKFAGIAWTPDARGFFYNRFPEPGTVAPEDVSNFQRVYWHTLGTAQEDDRLVYERPDFKELGFAPRATDDGAYLTLHVWRGTEPENRFYYAPLDPSAGDSAIVRLLDEADARYDFIDNADSLFYFVTDLDAPRGRVIAIDVEQPQREHWREIVPQGDDPIDQATLIHDELIVVTLHDVHHRVQRYSRDGALLGEIPPGLGTVAGISGRREDAEAFLGFTGYLDPLTTLRYDFASGELSTLRAPELDFDAARYETRQVFYPSKDGTRIPMFLTHRKGLALDGANPTLLYG
jgi:prolyl oligopeptidase